MAREIPQMHRDWLNLINTAAKQGTLALMDCTNPEGEARSVLCASYSDNEEVVFIPLAEMCEHPVPHEYYTPPMKEHKNGDRDLEGEVPPGV